MKFSRVLLHALTSVGSNDAQADVVRVRNMVQVREIHRAGMERRDLVVVQVGGNEGLRRERVGHVAHMRLGQAQFVHAIGVRLIVVADGRHDQRIAAEHFQRIGDISGTTAKLPAHFGYQERHVQDVNLVGKDVVLEMPAEHHDGVVGDRTADQRAHGFTWV